MRPGVRHGQLLGRTDTTTARSSEHFTLQVGHAQILLQILQNPKDLENRAQAEQLGRQGHFSTGNVTHSGKRVRRVDWLLGCWISRLLRSFSFLGRV